MGVSSTARCGVEVESSSMVCCCGEHHEADHVLGCGGLVQRANNAQVLEQLAFQRKLQDEVHALLQRGNT